MGTAAEQLLNGMMASQLLLAIPLFILAAEFMNTGSIMDRLLHFCNAIVGRFRGGLAQVNVVQSIIFASMSGSALADAAASGKIMQSMMTRDGKYPAGVCRGADLRVVRHRARSSRPRSRWCSTR
jgi:TRAP-type C4-dicarboxylate transport system permease large subunit